jgi:hypothetical protein
VRVVIPLIALLLAVIAGAMIVALSQLGAPPTGVTRGSGVPPPLGPAAVQTRAPTPAPTAQPTPAPTPAPTPTPALSPNPGPSPVADTWRYSIVAGDSLSLVAQRYGTTTERLVELNPQYQADIDRVEIGEELIVPCTPAAIEEGRCG